MGEVYSTAAWLRTGNTIWTLGGYGYGSGSGYAVKLVKIEIVDALPGILHYNLHYKGKDIEIKSYTYSGEYEIIWGGSDE